MNDLDKSKSSGLTVVSLMLLAAVLSIVSVLRGAGPVDEAYIFAGMVPAAHHAQPQPSTF